ncbi:MAG: sulfatase, partial [Candidatus Sumerlaeota bacterium]
FLNMATTTMHGPHHVESLRTDGRECEYGLLDEMPKVQPPRETVFERLEEAGLPVTHLTAGSLWMDDAFGAVMKKVEDMGLADNTIFIWSTDHGMGTRASKFTCYQGGVRIPYCMKWDGHIPAGLTTDALLENVDFLPTMCGAAGIGVPDEVKTDGLDRWAQLTGGEDDREDLFFEWGMTRAVRTQKYKYIALRHTPEQIEHMKNNPEGNAMSMSGKFGPDYPMHKHPHYFDPDQLYDLQADPDERVNLAENSEYAEVLADMKARLQEYLDTFPEPFDLDHIDPFVKTNAYRRLVENILKDERLWNFYFYIEEAY